MNSIFDFILGKILDRPLEIVWGFLSPILISILKYTWNNLDGLKIYAVVVTLITIILGFVVIWQFKKIKTLKEEIQFLTPPEKTTRELLADEVLLYIDSQKNENDLNYEEIDGITGDNSIEIFESLEDKGLIKLDTFEIISMKGIDYYKFIEKPNQILTIEGKDRIKEIKEIKSRFVASE